MFRPITPEKRRKIKGASAFFSFLLAFCLLVGLPASSYALSEAGSQPWLEISIQTADFMAGSWLSSYMANRLDTQDYIQNGVRVDYEKVPESKRLLEYDGLIYEVLPALYTEENVRNFYDKNFPGQAFENLTKEQMIYGKRRKNIIFRDGYAYRVKDLDPIIRYDQIERKVERVFFDEETKKSIAKVTARTKNASFYAETTYYVTFDPFVSPDYTLSGDALVEAFLAAHPEVSDTELRNGTYVSPRTGDSTVFLLPAAALSLGGLLLAAKKRKRTS